MLITWMRTDGVRDCKLMFGVIADSELLPKKLQTVVCNIRTWAEFLGRVYRAIPFHNVRLAIWGNLVALRPLVESKTRAAVAEFQQGLEGSLSLYTYINL